MIFTKQAAPQGVTIATQPTKRVQRTTKEDYEAKIAELASKMETNSIPEIASMEQQAPSDNLVDDPLLEELERAVTHSQLPSTQGFFFGNDADDHYRESDLEFIKNARAELFCGLKVFYNSSW